MKGDLGWGLWFRGWMVTLDGVTLLVTRACGPR